MCSYDLSLLVKWKFTHHLSGHIPVSRLVIASNDCLDNVIILVTFTFYFLFFFLFLNSWSIPWKSIVNRLSPDIITMTEGSFLLLLSSYHTIG